MVGQYQTVNQGTLYILEGKTPKLIGDIMEWARWYEKADRQVDNTTLPNNVNVSTVFLGFYHSFGGDTPLLFETRIFGGEHDDYQERYSTWEEAQEGHQRAVKIAKEKQNGRES